MTARANWRRPWEDVAPRRSPDPVAGCNKGQEAPRRPGQDGLVPPNPTSRAPSSPPWISRRECPPPPPPSLTVAMSQGPTPHLAAPSPKRKRPRLLSHDGAQYAWSHRADEAAPKDRRSSGLIEQPNSSSTPATAFAAAAVHRSDAVAGEPGTARAHATQVHARPDLMPAGEGDYIRHHLRELAWAVAQLDGELRRGMDGLMTNHPAPRHSRSLEDANVRNRHTGSACAGSGSTQVPDVLQVGIGPALEWTLGRIRNDVQMARRLATNAWETSASGTSGCTDRRSSFPTGTSCCGGPPTVRPVDVGRRGSEEERWTPQARSASTDEPTAGLTAVRSPTSCGPPGPRCLGPATPVSILSGSTALPPISPSSQTSQSAQTSHLQDLQHQVSTKTLALQTLQKEHENLLSALSRSQTRCSALERKFRVSDAEINNLTEERINLQAQVEALESEVESLTRLRDDARAESVANGGQYMRIVSMASALEAQSSSDKRRWEAEREAWEQTKSRLDERIAELEREKEAALMIVDKVRSRQVVEGPSQLNEQSQPHARPSYSRHEHSRLRDGGRSGSSVLEYDSLPLPAMTSNGTEPFSTTNHNHMPPDTCIFSTSTDEVKPDNEDDDDDDDDDDDEHSDGILQCDSQDELRAEIVRLRKGCRAMQVALQDLKSDGYRIEQVMHRFGNLGRRVVSRADTALRHLEPHAPPRKAKGESEDDKSMSRSEGATKGKLDGNDKVNARCLDERGVNGHGDTLGSSGCYNHHSPPSSCKNNNPQNNHSESADADPGRVRSVAL